MSSWEDLNLFLVAVTIASLVLVCLGFWDLSLHKVSSFGNFFSSMKSSASKMISN